jgi:hypothetical protein
LERHGIELDAAAIWPPRKGADAITWKPVRSHIDDLRTLQRE